MMTTTKSQQGEDEGSNEGTVVVVKEKIFWDVKPERDRVIPPLSFAMVNKGVYRSGYPNKRNFVFLESLQLKSILYLSPEKHEELKIGVENIEFIDKNQIQLFHYGLQGQKEPFNVTTEEMFRKALMVVLDTRNHPILVHCDKGKHRTGCLVGCLRRIQGWTLASVFDEYARFCHGSVRVLDHQFMELFSLGPHFVSLDKEYLPSWAWNLKT